MDDASKLAFADGAIGWKKDDNNNDKMLFTQIWKKC